MMTFHPEWQKHDTMRSILERLAVPNPTASHYYSGGSTVTTDALDEILRRVGDLLKRLEDCEKGK